MLSNQKRPRENVDNDNCYAWKENMTESHKRQNIEPGTSNHLKDTLSVLKDLVNLTDAETSDVEIGQEIRHTRFKVEKCDILSYYHFVLTLKNDANNNDDLEYTLDVKGRWCDGISYEPGATISFHPCSTLLKYRKDCISNEEKDKVLILYPNFLVSGTTIVSSLRCKRQTVLNELFKRSGFAKPLLLGNIMHQIFTTCFQNKNFSRSFFLETYKKVCQNISHLEAFFALDMSPDFLGKEIEQYISPVARLGGALMGKFPNNSLQAMGVEKLSCEQVERNIWSPTLGLKGKMDIITGTQNSDEKVVLELKTGRDTNSIEHQDQVRLYNKILKSEGIFNSAKGALVYLKSGKIYPVSDQSLSIRELIIIRNTLVYFLTQSGLKINRQKEFKPQFCMKLPDLEEDQFNCSNCDQRFNCGLLSRISESKSTEQTPKLTELHADSFVVSPDHLRFFSKWYNLCLLEFPILPEPDYSKMWMQTFEETRAKGTTEGNFVIKTQKLSELDSCVVNFEKDASSNELVSNLISGERVLISTQCLSAINVAAGVVKNVTQRSADVAIDQPITMDQQKVNEDMKWRLDKANQETTTSSTLSLMLSNLSQLMSQSGNSRVKRLRQLILENEDALFEDTDKHLIPIDLRQEARTILMVLNGQQKLAVRKVLMSHDYTIIRGMPGSGKTTVIVAVIRLLVLCGHRILLTSFTNAAVDNVLLKLKSLNDSSIKIVRLGVKSRVHADLVEYLPGSNGLSYDNVNSQFMTANVVAGTVFNVNHPIFSGSKRKFNFCIVDEASQILLPLCIGPLFAAQRFVLVGDENQLAPLVSNEKAKQEGLSESLFEYIATRNNKAVFSLCEQYRMNSKIMELSNKLSYRGQMRAANQKVAERILDLKLKMSCTKSCCRWLNSSFDPKNAAVFIDTSKCDSKFEQQRNNSYFNLLELEVVRLLLKILKKCGLSMDNVGVICPYRQQLVQAQTKLCSAGSEFAGLEIHTVDKFQGRDKEVIILTCVRSKSELIQNSEEIEGKNPNTELLNDNKRVNVAVSRAKSKIIIIGDLETLNTYQPLAVIITILTSKNCVFSYKEHESDH
ncbi:DNA replication ATP-dependent helicase/nuclease DNA2-like [Symsagittifera roscoffensis]|uniref:DNA replication ATP-dependent helicase/nuclease DNA2-like n=1 Tax=Symsagittifera roscoffensis TaxID=84072 RepID=UPI00307CA5C7